MKHICMLTSAHPALDTRVFYKESRTLVAAGYAVTIVAPHEGDIVVDGVSIKGIKKHNGRLKRMTLMVFAVFRSALSANADAYHFHDPELLFAALMLRLLGKKVIYDVHENYGKSILSRSYLSVWARKPIAGIISRLEQAISGFFSAVVTATDEIQENFAGHHRAVRIYNYPFLPTRAALPRKAGQAGALRLIYVGGLIEINGISKIVSAMEFLPPADGTRLSLYGEFRPANYGDEVRALPGFARVDWRGLVPYADALARMAESDAGFVCCLPVPNSMNSLPNKMFEYMSAGLPVIASNFPMWKKILEGPLPCGVCVDPESPEEIAKGIQYLRDNPEQAKRFGENGRKAVEEIYNWEKEAVKLVALYKEVLPQ